MTMHSGHKCRGSMTYISFKKSTDFGLTILPGFMTWLMNQKSTVIIPNAVIKYTDHAFSHLGKSSKNKIAKTPSNNTINANGMSIDFSDFLRVVLSIRQSHFVSWVKAVLSSFASFRLLKS